MRTFLDTNVLSALWMNEPSAALIEVELMKARREGPLTISVFTHAECHGCPGAGEEYIAGFLENAGIDVDSRFPDAMWPLINERFAQFAERRRGKASGPPRRILADFLIGAHAQYRSDRLMTLDAGFFARNYPELRLYELAV